MKESNLHREIMIAASEHGHRLFRNNVGKLQDRKGMWVAFGIGGKGGSDLIGIQRGGRFAAIEVKVPGEKPTEDQVSFIEAVKRAGGVAGVARSVDEALAILAEA
jgi:hypothetical protein